MKSALLFGILLGLSQKFDKPISDFSSNSSTKSFILNTAACYGLHMFLCASHVFGHIIAAKLAARWGAKIVPIDPNASPNSTVKGPYGIKPFAIKKIPIGITETYPEFQHNRVDTIVNVCGPVLGFACSLATLYGMSRLCTANHEPIPHLDVSLLEKVSLFHMGANYLDMAPMRLDLRSNTEEKQSSNYTTSGYRIAERI